VPDRRLGLPVAVAAAFAVAGCTATASGQSAPPTTHGGVMTPAPPVSTALSLPPRPDSYPLNGIDPCELITPQQQATLKVDEGNRLADDQQFGQPVCAFRMQGAASVSDLVLTSVATEGVEFWSNPALADTVKPVSVAGFPAVDITSKAQAGAACETAVSVNDGQMLLVNLGLPPVGTTRGQSCALTEQAGAAALATLQTVK
jgi:hypothetical protein